MYYHILLLKIYQLITQQSKKYHSFMSLSKQVPDDAPKFRETMFQFLKRKKQNEKEKSIIQYHNSSQQSFYNSFNNSVGQRDYESKQKPSALYQNFLAQQYSSIPLISNKKSKFANTTSVTPRKITFAEELDTAKQKSSRKPLIDLISPNRNVGSSSFKSGSVIKFFRQGQKIEEKQQKNPRKSILKETSLIKNTCDPFAKRKINVSVDNLQQIFQKLFQAGKTVKQKNKDLSIALVNLVKDFDRSRTKQNSSTQKKLGQIKYILNAIDAALQIFNQYQAASQIVDEFRKDFTEHLYQIESGTNHNLKQYYEQEILKLTHQKQVQIDDLFTGNRKLERQVQKLNKFIQKTQKQYESRTQQYQERQQNLLNTISNLKKQNQEIQLQANERSEQLKRILENQREKSKTLEKQLKNVLHNERKTIDEYQAQRIQKTSARQAFLIEQIQNLRYTFNTDISELHKLYKAKQVNFQNRIQELVSQLEKQKHQRKCDREVSNKILVEANLSRNDKIKVTKKNDEIMQDLYRMNENFFQHWLALKDIKTLSQRLKIFQHFERIYRDLAFNPSLFRV